MADRRLSSKGRAHRDDAQKLLLLNTDDGKAILGYSGLGMTSLGTEPSDWMISVLRGRRLPLEQSLSALADAVKTQVPRHLIRLPAHEVLAHNIIVPAFVHNEPRFYSIDIVFSQDRKSYGFRSTRHVCGPTGKTRTPRLAIGGSGAVYLIKRKDWMRHLLRVVKAYDCERITGLAAADQFAALNDEVYRNQGGTTVGPRCIVAWRNIKDGAGGAQQFYTDTVRDAASPCLPTVANGTDMRAIIGVLMPHVMKNLEAMMAGQPSSELDKDQLNAELARLPDKPDENLR
jgi:hypothetical protein